MSKIEHVFVTTKPPRHGDPGAVEPGYFRTVDDVVSLVDSNGVQRFDKKGKPIQQKLNPGEDARKIAYRLIKKHMPKPRNDFNRPINYGPTGKF